MKYLMLDILTHPQLAGVIHSFLTGNPNTFMSLRLVCRSVGTHVTCWMEEEVCEYVLSCDRYPIRPEYLCDMALVCGRLGLAPFMLLHDDPSSFHPSMLSAGGASSSSSSLWHQKVHPALGEEDKSQNVWRGIGLLMEAYDRTSSSCQMVLYYDWAVLSVQDIGKRFVGLGGAHSDIWRFIYNERFNANDVLDESIHGEEYTIFGSLSKAVVLDPTVGASWDCFAVAAIDAYEAQGFPPSRRGECKASDVLRTDIDIVNKQIHALSFRQVFLIKALFLRCGREALNNRWKIWLAANYDSFSALVNVEFELAICTCLPRNCTAIDTAPVVLDSCCEDAVIEFLCVLLGEPNGWCWPIFRLLSAYVPQRIQAHINATCNALHEQWSWSLHSQRCALRVLLWINDEVPQTALGLPLDPDQLVRWLSSESCFHAAAKVLHCIFYSDVAECERILLDSDGAILRLLCTIPAKRCAMPEIQPIVFLFSDWVTMNPFDAEELDELKTRVQLKLVEADVIGHLLIAFSSIQLETRRRERMMRIRNQILSVVDVLLHSHIEYFKSASKTYVGRLRQLWQSNQKSIERALRDEQGPYALERSSERLKRMESMLKRSH